MFKDKVAVVTGGSRGIGRAVSLKFAQGGASVAVIFAGNEEAANETVSEIEALGAKAKAYKCDVADFENTTEVFKQIINDFGTIDILVNNAGITKDKIMLSMKPDDFNKVISANLTGAFNTIKQVYPVMMRKKSGKIINMSSVSGLMGNAGQTNYSSSKAGLVGLTKSVAKELAGRGICCNAVAPGFVATDMTTSFQDNEEVINSIPLKRFAAAEEVAELVAFLASDKANYITGEVIRIDGGLAM
ncbi:MAG: 3-oxoacyl-[acyl-carrier-protein] reductase [Acutalibacteraceae bacterium]